MVEFIWAVYEDLAFVLQLVGVTGILVALFVSIWKATERMIQDDEA